MNEPRNRSRSLLVVLLGVLTAGTAGCGASADAENGSGVETDDSFGSSGTGEGVGGGSSPGSSTNTKSATTTTTTSSSSGGGAGGTADGESPAPTATSPGQQHAEPGPSANARRDLLTTKLGVEGRFLVGVGNDSGGNDPNQAHSYGLGTKLDIHYMYLSGLDWPTWNSPEGSYITMQAQAAKSRGMIPMFTLYQGAAMGEANVSAFSNTTFMTKYWHNVRVMYQRLNDLNSPSIVHLEPDLWGIFQKKGDAPSSVVVKVGSLVPECAGMPEDVSGFGKCLVKLSRLLAPKTIIGLSASTFGAYTNGASDPKRIAEYLNKVGSLEADYLAVETLDRDAGCFEKASDPNCKRSGDFYWDESNATHPNFHDHLAWAKSVHQITGKGLLWWQMPLGVPSDSAGGTSLHYRDNRVRYFFSHPQEFADAGGIGAVFGTGAGNQTTVMTDAGQFKTAVAKYKQAPVWL
jgi:hypothetical protein